MPRLEELAAFRAAVSLLERTGQTAVLDHVYERCLLGDALTENAVKEIYSRFTDDEIAAEMTRMLTPDNISARVDLVFQTLEGLHDAIPDCPGDWYFSGDYPTPGGVRQVNKAFVDYYRRRKS